MFKPDERSGQASILPRLRIFSVAWDNEKSVNRGRERILFSPAQFFRIISTPGSDFLLALHKLGDLPL